MYKILIADDEELEREALRFFINESSLDIDQVIECASGTEVIKRVMLDRPDIIVLDINMPVMDGYDALRLIRERAPDIPVIALTAYAFETDRQRMFQAGFNECLAKPLRADELRSRIASLLSR